MVSVHNDHVDIKEQNKPNQFSLGRSLWIGNDVSALSPNLLPLSLLPLSPPPSFSLSLTLTLSPPLSLLLAHSLSHSNSYIQEYEDLDEILVWYIQPIAASTRDMLNHKCYKKADGGIRRVSKNCSEMRKAKI